MSKESSSTAGKLATKPPTSNHTIISKYLITGGAGFIGSNLIRSLLEDGSNRVLNLDNLTYAGNLQSLADVASNPAYTFAQVDITNAAAVSETINHFRPDGIFHLAAESHVDRSIDGPRQFIETNVVGTLNLLDASLHYWRSLPDDNNNADDNNAIRKSFRFLHVSTDEVYGSLGPEGQFTEQTPYDPHSPYSASKAGSDHLARAWHDTYGLPVLVTNCSNNYGPNQFPEKLIPVVILKCLAGEPIPVYGQGENIRDWLYVEDHCQALQRVMQQGTPGETYNIGGNNELKNIDLVRKLCQLLDELHPSPTQKPHAEKITHVPDRPGHDQRYAIDASKIKTQLDWTPQEGFTSGLRKTVEWYLENETWWRGMLPENYNGAKACV